MTSLVLSELPPGLEQMTGVQGLRSAREAVTSWLPYWKLESQCRTSLNWGLIWPQLLMI